MVFKLDRISLLATDSFENRQRMIHTYDEFEFPLSTAQGDTSENFSVDVLFTRFRMAMGIDVVDQIEPIKADD